jgi:hypothetical protein
MSTENLIARALQIVGVILGAGGGFLIGIAPPDRVAGEGNPRFAVGLATLAGVVLLLIVSSLTGTKSKPAHRKFWLTAGSILFVLFILGAITYPSTLDRLTFLYPEGVAEKQRYNNGTDLTPAAIAASKRYEEEKGFPPSKAKLVAGFAGIEHISRVWTPESIRRAERTILVWYLTLTLSLMGAIFSLAEGLLRNPASSR